MRHDTVDLRRILFFRRGKRDRSETLIMTVCRESTIGRSLQEVSRRNGFQYERRVPSGVDYCLTSPPDFQTGRVKLSTIEVS